MHDHRSDHRPTGVAAPDTIEYEHQRRLILELAVRPPVDGDHPRALADTLGLSRAALEAAAIALVAVGLAEWRAGRLLASQATVALDALWPLAL